MSTRRKLGPNQRDLSVLEQDAADRIRLIVERIEFGQALKKRFGEKPAEQPEKEIP